MVDLYTFQSTYFHNHIKFFVLKPRIKEIEPLHVPILSKKRLVLGKGLLYLLHEPPKTRFKTHFDIFHCYYSVTELTFSHVQAI